MFIAQITGIEFELKGPELLGHTCNPKTGYFQDKTRISKKNRSSREILLTAEYIAESNVPCFPFT